MLSDGEGPVRLVAHTFETRSAEHNIRFSHSLASLDRTQNTHRYILCLSFLVPSVPHHEQSDCAASSMLCGQTVNLRGRYCRWQIRLVSVISTANFTD